MNSPAKNFEGKWRLSRFYIKKGVTLREATVVSVCLHFGIVAAAATMFLGRPQLIGPPVEELNLKLELLAESEPAEQPTFDYSKQAESAGNEQAAENNGIGSPQLGGDQVAEKQALLLASLNTLSALRESFSFVTHEVISDSAGAFIPIQGMAPDIRSLADGLNTAIEMGVRTGKIGIGGGGNCPPDGIAK